MSAYELIFDYRDNKHHNNDFLNLIKKSGKSCLEDWMTKGHWDENYVPFALINNKGEIVANIGAIKFSLFIEGVRYNAVQLGQVIIKDSHKDQNLEEELIALIVSKYENIVDVIFSYDPEISPYLIKNHGFMDAHEYKYFKDWDPNLEPSGNIIKKIDTDGSKELAYIQTEIKHSTRMSKKIATSGDSQIKLFNILKYFRKNVYYIPSFEAIAVFSFTDGLFQLAGVYSKNNIEIDELLRVIVPLGINKIEFGFIPYVSDLQKQPLKYNTGHMPKIHRLAINAISAPIDFESVLFPMLSRIK
ncbi:hypothetical protein ESOMN_v1c01060 [Williamsoniiplasma somnilux]|uniref:Acetyltransferase n=1 Tax=Williamsoniiplasma somnilux TaxID=215578 RepID=A0A2K8P0G6_9MOLU|nr:hypothetical protein [Williamsoniiplasma somnilux]ATZ18491.1 hypothetical protein ESOMN_v1c01060 [Williamsoniiplasma somnilux]